MKLRLRVSLKTSLICEIKIQKLCWFKLGYRLQALPIKKLEIKLGDSKVKPKAVKRKFDKPKKEPLIVPSDEKVLVNPDLIVAAESLAKHQARSQLNME